jgi:hypothetical protein
MTLQTIQSKFLVVEKQDQHVFSPNLKMTPKNSSVTLALE